MVGSIILLFFSHLGFFFFFSSIFLFWVGSFIEDVKSNISIRVQYFSGRYSLIKNSKFYE